MGPSKSVQKKPGEQRKHDRQELNLKLRNISFAFFSQYSETPILQTGSVSNKMSANPELSAVLGHVFYFFVNMVSEKSLLKLRYALFLGSAKLKFHCTSGCVKMMHT